jgi:hypothetical protein
LFNDDSQYSILQSKWGALRSRGSPCRRRPAETIFVLTQVHYRSSDRFHSADRNLGLLADFAAAGNGRGPDGFQEGGRMRMGKAWHWGLAAALLLPGCLAAPSAAPTPAAALAAPAAAGTPAGAASAAAVAAPSPPNLWSFLCPTPEQKLECRQKLCNSFLGKMLSSMFAPLRLLTGGSAASPCAQLSDMKDLAAPADSADGAAARIKAEEAGAAKRRESVRYLGRVDCRYWPEAEGSLIKALRSDPNECVRYEAAAALRHGCCCTRPILEALVTTVSGSDKDGFPAEHSQRVKSTALEALHHCLESCAAISVTPVPAPVRPEKPTPPEKPAPAAGKPGELDKSMVLPLLPRGVVVQSAYYQNLSRAMNAQLLEDARRLDMQYPPWPRPGEHGLFGLLLEMQNVPIHPTVDAPSTEPPLFPIPDQAIDDLSRPVLFGPARGGLTGGTP